ncbi:MAG: DinB family protein [Gemmatimonadota bacterium]|nr:DinB family protein [Gemmatimonadota bacterium]
MSSTPIQPATDSADRARSVAARRVETPAEYTRRIVGYAEGKDPFTILETTAGRLRRIVRDTAAEVLRRRPAPGRWSPVEIIAHLADAEIVVSYRLRLILAHNGIDVQAFDQNEWATNLSYETVDPRESVDLFEATRTANLRLLRRVDPRLYENYGMHNERGRESVSHMIRLYAGHDLNHLAQIEAIVG